VSLAVSSDARLAASGDDSGLVLVWDLSRLAFAKRMGKLDGPVRSLAFAVGDKRLLASAGDVIYEWDLVTGSKVGMEGRRGTFLSPDATRALTLAQDDFSLARFQDMADGRALGSTRVEDTTALDVSFTSDGAQLLLVGEKQVVTVIDVRKTRGILRIHIQSPMRKLVQSLCWGVNQNEVILGCSDGAFRANTLSTPTAGRLIQVGVHRGSIWSVASTSDGKKILSGGEDGLVSLMPSDTGTPVLLFEGHRSSVRKVLLWPGGRFALSGAEDGSVRAWNLASPTTRRDLPVLPRERQRAAPLRKLSVAPMANPTPAHRPGRDNPSANP
jgi:WD40 repeat protein